MHETEEQTERAQGRTVAPERRGMVRWPVAMGIVVVAIVIVQAATAASLATVATVATPASTSIVVSTAPTVVQPTALPTVDSLVADEVKDAYQRYWDVSAQALRDLDSTQLAEVATNGELAAL